MTPPDDPAVSAEEALLLLRTGRAHMAQWQLAKLPDRIRKAVAEARAEGHRCGKAEATASASAQGQRQGYQADLQAGAEAERARPAAGSPTGAPTASVGALRPSQRPAGAFPLAQLCATPEGREAAAAALKIRDRDLDAIIAGRVKLAPSGLKRLWAAVPATPEK